MRHVSQAFTALYYLRGLGGTVASAQIRPRRLAKIASSWRSTEIWLLVIIYTCLHTYTVRFVSL